MLIDKADTVHFIEGKNFLDEDAQFADTFGAIRLKYKCKLT